MFKEIGNGGFGPGAGLVGILGGHTDDDGRSLVDLHELLGVEAERTGLPPGVVPLCYFGCGAWACLDAATGHVLTLDETGATDTGVSFEDWLAAWTRGVKLYETMFDFEERTVANPFTHQRMTTRATVRARGVPYVWRKLLTSKVPE